MNKNEVKNLKNSLSSNTGSNILNEINTKNISYQKDVSTNKNNTPKNKSISSNHIFVPFEEDTPYELIKAIGPDVLTKGGDYIPEQIVGSELVIEMGGTVKVLPFVEGKSSSKIISKVKAL